MSWKETNSSRYGDILSSHQRERLVGGGESYHPTNVRPSSGKVGHQGRHIHGENGSSPVSPSLKTAAVSSTQRATRSAFGSSSAAPSTGTSNPKPLGSSSDDVDSKSSGRHRPVRNAAQSTCNSLKSLSSESLSSEESLTLSRDGILPASSSESSVSSPSPMTSGIPAQPNSLAQSTIASRFGNRCLHVGPQYLGREPHGTSQFSSDYF
ncbi:hypothetical protein FPV67DRAFT_1452210 [Lyophyllum atratum]|nr:hypothetical protein FPV67DRAFT_1452210 [Lyophyllum atratum]